MALTYKSYAKSQFKQALTLYAQYNFSARGFDPPSKCTLQQKYLLAAITMHINKKC